MPEQSGSIIRGIGLSEEPGLGALTLPGFLREVTARFADRESLVQRRPDGSVERWTYRDLWECSVAVANSLAACGLGKGERVGVLMTNRAEFLSAAFGAALAGGVAVPLSTFPTAYELEYLIGASACSVLLLERDVRKKDFAYILYDLDPAIGAAGPGALASLKFPFLRYLEVVDDATQIGAIETWSSFLARGTASHAVQIEGRTNTICPADPEVLFFSSGSTAKPKGILSTHRGVAIQLWRMAHHLGLKTGVRSWTANGYFWSGNFVMVLGATLAAGGSLGCNGSFNRKRRWRSSNPNAPTFFLRGRTNGPNWRQRRTGTRSISPACTISTRTPPWRATRLFGRTGSNRGMLMAIQKHLP